MAMAVSDVVIQLAPMQQLAEAVSENDDWTGLTDAAARRKRQNRLNQRAYRRRKAIGPRTPNFPPHIDLPVVYQNCCSIEIPDNPAQNSKFQTQCRRKQRLIKFLLDTLTESSKGSENRYRLKMAVGFPLSTDHLIPLIQFNVLRAILTNMSIMSLLDQIPDECGTTLCNMPLHPAPSKFPECLTPTKLQMTVPHPHWIDIIPSPRMRDNFILTAGTYEEEDLCSDFVGGLFEGEADLDNRGWIIWQEPWDVAGWEVTEGFVKKWGFILKGCTDVIEETNKWRVLRGEDRLIVEV